MSSYPTNNYQENELQFRDYIELTGKTLEQVGRELGVCTVTVCRWRSGQRIPEPGLMRKIIVWSRGNVMPNDFYPLRGEVAR